ncbi:MAG: Hpt domain-containing protein [Acidobacteria bacterium]|nr:Hpt domain-containing protein [Acidobacteriota bacterium]
MTDESFEDTFLRLRRRYREKAHERLTMLESRLDELARPESSEALEEMRQAFHKFSGSGATYGFARVSELGLEGELHCDAMQKRGGPVESTDVERLRNLVGMLRREFAE